MKKTILTIAFGVVCGLLGAGIVLLASQPPRGSAIKLSPPPTPRLWVVQVSGAVVQPGVYELPEGSRVRDAVQSAGGLTVDAYLSGVNLAALLEDGQSIIIQANPSIPAQRGNALSVTTEPAPAQGLPTSAASIGFININTATLEEFDQLPGIGPVIAQRILDYRTTNGPFATIEDIMNVPGIGTATFNKIKDLITSEP